MGGLAAGAGGVAGALTSTTGAGGVGGLAAGAGGVAGALTSTKGAGGWPGLVVAAAAFAALALISASAALAALAAWAASAKLPRRFAMVLSTTPATTVESEAFCKRSASDPPNPSNSGAFLGFFCQKGRIYIYIREMTGIFF